jgi:hypothetical protein
MYLPRFYPHLTLKRIFPPGHVPRTLAAPQRLRGHMRPAGRPDPAPGGRGPARLPYAVAVPIKPILMIILESYVSQDDVI